MSSCSKWIGSLLIMQSCIDQNLSIVLTWNYWQSLRMPEQPDTTLSGRPWKYHWINTPTAFRPNCSGVVVLKFASHLNLFPVDWRSEPEVTSSDNWVAWSLGSSNCWLFGTCCSDLATVMYTYPGHYTSMSMKHRTSTEPITRVTWSTGALYQVSIINELLFQRIEFIYWLWTP